MISALVKGLITIALFVVVAYFTENMDYIYQAVDYIKDAFGELRAYILASLSK